MVVIEDWKQQLVLNLVRLGIIGAIVSLLLNFFSGFANGVTQSISLIFLFANVIFLLLPLETRKKNQLYVLYSSALMMLSYWLYALFSGQDEFTRVSIMYAIAMAFPLLFGLEFILSPASKALKGAIAKIILIATLTLPYAIVTRNDAEALTGFPSLVILVIIYSAFVMLMYSFSKLEVHLSQTRQNAQDPKEIAFFDVLTGIPNRRSAEAMIEQAIATNQSTFSVVLIDIDHFKKINDTYGPSTGDRVLQQFSTYIKRKLRGPDMVARWGGEEFLLITLNTDTPGCLAITERLQEDMKQVVFPVSEVTFSGGIATYQSGDTLESLLKRADHALYQAKASGRNRLRFFGPADLSLSYAQ
jgi:diguanylate cyclase (GGDEF)-like protein